MSKRWVMAAVFAVAGCGAVDEPPADELAPEAVAKDDSGYVVEGARRWYLVGNALTKGDDRLELSVRAPAGTRVVDLWLDGARPVRLRKAGDVFSASVDVSALPPGDHEVRLAANWRRTAFQKIAFKRSHPLYVVVSNDWDDADNADATLTRQEELHARHPELKLTHFVGPYTFTDPEVSPERAALLTTWVKRMRDTYGDEIGVHIHPRCSFVKAAGVTCRATPSFAYANGDTSGYTVILASYTEAEMGSLLAKADDLFLANGLGKPTSFRAGGWTAETHTLKALGEAGYVADTSAVNWQRMEEWRWRSGAVLYPWNMARWNEIDEKSQPFRPAGADLLEVPDNGILVDYVSAEEMIEIFEANWSGQALVQPTQVSIGYHPPNFSEAYKERMHGALDHIDQYLVSADRGPVIYARLSDLSKVWPKAELP